MYLKIIKLFLCIHALSFSVLADETIYYSEVPKYIEINSIDETLFKFESPAISVSCQPKGVVEFDIIKSLDNLTSNVFQQNPLLADSFAKSGKEEVYTNPLAFLLKATPTTKNIEARCIVNLSSGGIASLRIIGKEGVSRPMINMLHSSSAPDGVMSVAHNYLDIFGTFVKGKNIAGFRDITLDLIGNEKKTKLGHYLLKNAYTDSKFYTAWIFEVEAKENIQLNPRLNNVGIGDVYLSTLLINSKNEPLKKGKVGELFLLTRNSIAINDLLGMLP